MSTWKGFSSETTPESAIDAYVSEPPTHRSLQGTGNRSPGQGKRPASRRGTTNVNVRGNTEDRRKRREYLVETYRADVDLVFIPGLPVSLGGSAPYTVPSCRCYRCGELLTAETVTVDRIKPGCRGGTYARNNIRPCCPACNSETGGSTRGRTRR